MSFSRPDKASASKPPEFNAEALATLDAMGFPLVRSQKALLATGNADANAAMEWLFAHMDDPGAASPPPDIALALTEYP